MEAQFVSTLLWCLWAALLGSVLFTFIGLIAGTSETATIAPAVLLVVLVGFPPAAAFTFCIAAVAAKHIIHAVPTAILGVPGDNMAIPMLEPCAALRALGAPHMALQKMISGAVLGMVLSIPIAVSFALLLAPFGKIVQAWSGLIFTIVAIGIAYASKGRWASIFMLIPFGLLIQAFEKLAINVNGKAGLQIAYLLGMAVGPMFVDVLGALSPVARSRLVQQTPTEFWLAPEFKPWAGFIPNPLGILTARQKLYILISTALTSLTFTFSPVGTTLIVGQVVEAKVKGLYEKLTTSVAVMNAATESTYMAEIIIPLVAFGLPLSPIAMQSGIALFIAPPVFTTSPMHNVHTLVSPLQICGYGLLAVIVAACIAYPLAMNYARRASAWVLRNISQESILTMFAGLVVVISYYEAGWIGVGISVTIGSIGGILQKFFGINIGVQMMAFYASAWIAHVLFGAK